MIKLYHWISTRYHNISDKISLQPQYISARIDCYKTTHRLNSSLMFAALPSTAIQPMFRRRIVRAVEGSFGHAPSLDLLIVRDRNDCCWKRLARSSSAVWQLKTMCSGTCCWLYTFGRCILSVVIFARICFPSLQHSNSFMCSHTVVVFLYNIRNLDLRLTIFLIFIAFNQDSELLPLWLQMCECIYLLLLRATTAWTINFNLFAIYSAKRISTMINL